MYADLHGWGDLTAEAQRAEEDAEKKFYHATKRRLQRGDHGEAEGRESKIEI